MRIFLAIGLVACFWIEPVSAAPSAVPAKLIVQRSAGTIQHRYAIHPEVAKLPVNQTQQFQVTDSQGNPVNVHWNVSGLGCSGMGCGTVDEHGIYRTPATLPQPRVVILEGVLDSDPNYSVLTRIELAPAVTVSGTVAPSPVAKAAVPQMPGLNVARGNTHKELLPPLPKAIGAAPVVEARMARVSSAPPQPNVTAPPPVIERQAVAARDLPLPRAIGAPPVVETQVDRASSAPLLASVTAPSPVVERQHVAARNLPLPRAIDAPPTVERGTVTRASQSIPMAKPANPQPVVERQNLSARDLPPLQGAIAAPPAAPVQIARSVSPLPQATASAPPVDVKQAAAVRTPTLSQHDLNTGIVIETQIARGSSSPSTKVSAPKPVAVIEQQPKLVVEQQPKPIVEQQKITAREVPSPQAATPQVKSQVAALGSLPRPLHDVVVEQSAGVIVSKSNAQQVAVPAPTEMTPVRTVLLPLPVDGSGPATSQTSAQTSASQNAPTVTYQDGLLTIDAPNSTLADVLKLVAEKSGATIEIPPGTGLERIVEHTGPAPAQDVLARLLNGSAYDFIIVSSPQIPHGPAQVLLSLHKPDLPAAIRPELPRPAPVSAALYTPPAETPAAMVLPLTIDPSSLPPKEQLTPEVVGQMMRDRGEQLRQAIQQQQPQQ
jgi:hypothetical protein